MLGAGPGGVRVPLGPAGTCETWIFTMWRKSVTAQRFVHLEHLTPREGALLPCGDPSAGSSLWQGLEAGRPRGLLASTDPGKSPRV